MSQRSSLRTTALPVSSPKRPSAMAAGFTLTEVMIVVALITLLAAIAIPNFARARKASQVRACITNLRRLEDAKAQWAMENRKSDTAYPYTTDVIPYLKNNRLPACPANGTYRVRRLTSFPRCSQYSIGHSLDNLDMDDDPDPN
jgi:prepilin-type N-terminal cleavage/methylation domain-containing protein